MHLVHPRRPGVPRGPDAAHEGVLALHRLGFELGAGRGARASRSRCDLVDDDFRRSADVRDLFLAICRSWGRVAQTLSARCTSSGCSAATCRSGARSPASCSTTSITSSPPTSTRCSPWRTWRRWRRASRRSRRAPRRCSTRWSGPDLLMLGMLLHDIGKGKGHGHVAKGIPLIAGADRADRVDPRRRRRRWCSWWRTTSRCPTSPSAATSTIPRRSPTLAETVRRRPSGCACSTSSPSPTCARSGPGVMTGWQAQILGELYRRTLARLTGGGASRPAATPVAERRVRRPCTGTGARRSGERAPRDDVRALSRRRRRPAHRRASAPGRAARRGRRWPPSCSTIPISDSSELVIVTRDVPGLFSLIAGTLAAHGINILSAQIHTRADGIAIDTFQVNDPHRRGGDRGGARGGGRSTRCAACCAGEQTVEALLARRKRAAGPGPRRCRGRPRSSVDNRLSDTAHRGRGEVPGPASGCSTRSRARCPSRGPRHRQRPHRHRDRPGVRHLLRDRPAGTASSRTRRPATRLTRSAGDALMQAALRCSSHYRASLRYGRRSRGPAALPRAGAAEPADDPRARRELRRGARRLLRRARCARRALLLVVAGLFDFFDGSLARPRRAGDAPSGPSSTRWSTATPTSWCCWASCCSSRAAPNRAASCSRWSRSSARSW